MTGYRRPFTDCNMSAWRNIMMAIVAFPNKSEKVPEKVVRKSALIAPVSGIRAGLKRLLHIGWVANKWHKSMKCSEANILIKTGQSANLQEKHGKTNLHKSFNRTPPFTHTHTSRDRDDKFHLVKEEVGQLQLIWENGAAATIWLAILCHRMSFVFTIWVPLL